jgi:hypothetical protein
MISTLSAPNAASLVAIDVHVHAHHAETGNSEAGSAAAAYFKSTDVPLDLDGVAEYYRTGRLRRRRLGG